MSHRFRWIHAVLITVLFGWASQALAFPTGDSRYEVEILVNGVPAREYLHEGRFYVMGAKGDRYAIRVRNRTGRRVEVVASVDGLDVIDGRKADYVNKRGYVLGPWQTYDIEGFRLDMGRVAAFRFAAVEDSYAAKQGDDRNVGVIGVAFFEERRPVVRRPAIIRPEASGGSTSDDRGAARSRKSSPGPAASASPPPARESAQGRLGGGGAGTEAAQDRVESESRPGLGTEFGEARDSRVTETTFRRANPRTPSALFAIWYNDRAGLLAMGVPVDGCPSDTCLRKTANPFPSNPADRRFSAPPPGWCP